MNAHSRIRPPRRGQARFEDPAAARARLPSKAIRVRAHAALVALDTLVIVASFTVIAVARGMLFDTQGMLVPLALLLPIYFGAALMDRAYSLEVLTDRWTNATRGARALAIAFVVVMLVTFSLKTTDELPRLTMALGVLLSIIGLVTARYLFSRHLTAIVGGNPYSSILIDDVGHGVSHLGATIVLSGSAYPGLSADDPVAFDRLAQDLNGADRVVVVCPPERRAAWSHALMGANIRSEIVVPELVALAPLGIGKHEGVPTLVVANGPLGLFDRLLKRGFDIAVASAALVLAAPLLIGTAIAIKRTSPGPVLFRQTRIGRSNKMFEMLKFRSMRTDDCDTGGDRSTARDDDRITRVGQFIRRTSIDELPQLINVLKGDMSIVGPRPHALGSRAAGKLFWEVDQRYWHRHGTKPGLTGLAQVRGYRGATLVEDDLVNRLHADLEYLESWSIWRDLKIVAMTVRVIVHRNAF